MSEVRAASFDEVPTGQPMVVDLHGIRVVLAKVGDRVYALGDVCAHQGGPLSEGKLSGTRLACPWHGWEFDLGTGRALLDARLRVRTFAARIVDGRVLVDFE